MYVYVISAGPDRQKVGKARDPEERRRLLQTGSTELLVTLHHQHVANARGVEGMAHQKLASHRLHGEWFAVDAQTAINAVRDSVVALGGETEPPSYERRQMPRKIVDGVGLEARRKAVREYHARRAETGQKKVTLWLTEEARLKLEKLKASAGSKDAAANLAIMAWEGPDAKPKPAKPAKAEPAPTSAVSVPFAGDVTRKPLQKSSGKRNQ